MKQGWETKKLGDVIQKTETIDPAKNPDIEFTYIDVSSVNNKDFFIESGTLLKGKDAPSRARKLIKTNDVIFATVRPTLKRIAIVEKEFDKQVCSTGYFVFRTKEVLHNRLLFYFLLSDNFNREMEKLQKGASYPAVTDSEVRNQVISFPKSLPEQHRIVAILEEVFASITKAKANAEQNLKNAKELFEALCHKELWFKCKDYPRKVLSEIVDLNRGGVKIGPFGSVLKIHELVDNGDARVLYIENIVNNKFDWEKEKRITSEKFNELRSYEVFSGDVLITIMGTIGRTAIVPKNLGRSIISSHLIKITPNPKLITSEFLNYSLNLNPSVVQQLFGQAKGAIMKGINSTIIKNLLIPLPPLKEQMITVNLLDVYRKETQRLETIYQRKLNDLEELKKSVLQKAFNGEL